MAEPNSFVGESAPWRMSLGLRGRRDGVMRGVHRSIGLGYGWHAGLLLAALAMPAHAVDIVNKDKVVRVVAINDSNGDANVVTLPAQQKYENVCKSCVVLMGNTSVEAEGNVTVVVERGKVSIAKK